MSASTCYHTRYSNNHCPEYKCKNYVNRCPKHSTSGRDYDTCTNEPNKTYRDYVAMETALLHEIENMRNKKIVTYADCDEAAWPMLAEIRQMEHDFIGTLEYRLSVIQDKVAETLDKIFEEGF